MKRLIIEIAAFAAILVLCIIGWWQVSVQSKAKERYQRNSAALMEDSEQYKVRDSLNAARVQTLELTLRDFQRLRSEDAELIKDLRIKAKDLASINKAQAQTIIRLSAIPRDTIIIRDSISIPAIAVHCGDRWYDFDGVLSKDEFTGTLRNRDSLVMVESVEYKRFLGFLWRTKQVKRKSMDIVSKNPHTLILGIEYLEIVK